MTIKELREKDALRLAQRENPNPTPEQIETARHTMRLYYNFARAYYDSFIINQDSKATQAQKISTEEKAAKRFYKASEALKKYNLCVCCPGLYPIIDDVNGQNFTYGHFYR